MTDHAHRPRPAHRQSGRDLLPRDLEFAASVAIRGSDAVARLEGELDLASHERCRRFLDELAATTSGTVVLDLLSLSFTDCGGALMLVRFAERCRVPVKLVLPARGPIRRVFDLLDEHSPAAIGAEPASSDARSAARTASIGKAGAPPGVPASFDSPRHSLSAAPAPV
jgi:anti-anti-sigma factor